MGSLEEYTDEEFLEQFQQAMKAFLTKYKIIPVKKPKAILLGGQSGAGKTTLHKVCSVALKNNAGIINGDEYRSFHPRYLQIEDEYGIDSPAHTAAWAGKMVEELIDVSSSAKYNLIIEGTLRTSEVPIKTATLLRERGYGVSLALMAVKPEISLISCQLRYEQMRIAGTVPRAVDPEHHRVIVENIVDNLETLEASPLFDSIALYSRAGACLYSSDSDKRRANEALRDILFGEWTPEEEMHYDYLKERLEEAKGQDSSASGEL